AFRGDDPVKRAAIFCLDGVGQEVRGHLAIRIEDVDEYLIGAPLTDGGKVRANVLAKVAGAMAGGTGGLENFPATSGVALHRERDLGAEGRRAGRPLGQEQRRGLWLSETADGRDGSDLDFLRLFRVELAGERGVDAVEGVEGKEVNGDDADVE